MDGRTSGGVVLVRPRLFRSIQPASCRGHFPGEVSAEGSSIVVDGRKITVVAEKDPAKIPWKDHGVEVALECTGRFTEAESAKLHLRDGVKKVLNAAAINGTTVTTIASSAVTVIALFGIKPGLTFPTRNRTQDGS